VNGAGKSTLLKLVAGMPRPTPAAVTLGAAVKLGYFAQALDGGARRRRQRLGDAAEAFPNASIGSLRALAGCFGFSGDEIEKRCRLLSGGENGEARAGADALRPANFLVLDEPTNHLDLVTKEMLIRALGGFDRHDAAGLARSTLSRALTNRVLELVPGDPRVLRRQLHRVRRGERHEAPGMRS